MTLTDFLLARIAEDEERADRVEFRPYVGEGVPRSLRARVLAECDAKRRIIDAHDRQCGDDDDRAWIVASAVLLRALALPYADHPDYREEWKP